MSKGKRKSAPGVVVLIRQKLRNRTLTKEDRPILKQCSRLDLIALIEGETGVVLTGSQKNSVAAMINWLLGPEEGATAGRLTQRARKPQTLKKKARQDGEPGLCANARKALHRITGVPQLKLEQLGTAPVDSAVGRESGSSWRGDGQTEQVEEANKAVGCRPTHAYSCPTHGQSSDTGQPRFAHEQAHWLRELQMQLAAAATAEDDPEDPDAAGTAQSAMRAAPVPALQGATAGCAPQQLTMFAQHSAVPVGLTDDELESHLLQQLLQDMQLSTQQQQQATPPLPSQPAPPSLPLQQQPLLPQGQGQPLQQLQPQDLLPQPQLAHLPLQQPHRLPLQLPRQLLPEEMLQIQQLERLKQKKLQLQQQLEQSLQLEQQQLLQQQAPHAANLEHQQLLQQQLQQSANLQQQQLLQQQLQLSAQIGAQPLVPPAAAAAVPGYSSHSLGSVDLSQMQARPFIENCLTHSSPLPSTAPESWTGNIPRVFEQGARSLSSSIPVWPQQPCEVTESGSMTLKKRDRQQLFQQLLQGANPSAPLTVELSGPSADLTIKRRSLQVSLPGGGESFSAVASAFAGGSFAGRSAQSAPPTLAPPFARELMDEQQEPQQPEMQQQQKPPRRSGLKKGMKGLAKKFKQLLGGKHTSSSHQQQQLQQPLGSFAGRIGSSASAPAAVKSDDDIAVDLLANIDMEAYAAEPIVLPGHQPLTRSAPSNRLPSMTGSFGNAPTGVGSWPSWTATAPGSVTRRVQHSSFVSSFNSFAGTTGGSFAGTVDGSFADVGAGSGSGHENFSERLKVLRAMYNSQYETPKPHEEAAGASNSGMYIGPAAGASVEPSLPALKEEDMPQAATAAQEGRPPHTNSPVPFMQKLTKAFGLAPKMDEAEGTAAAAAAAAGLSVTERSNSSFSLFLARVASGWRHDSSSTAAATFHEDSYPPSAVGKGSFSTTAQPSSLSQSAHPSLGSYTAERSSFSQSVNFSHPSHPSLGSGRWAVDHSSFSQTVNRSMPSMNTDRSSFSQTLNLSMGSTGAPALGGSFNAAVPPCTASLTGAGSSAQVTAAAATVGPEIQQTGAGAATAAAAAVERSLRSSSRTLELQHGSDTSSQAAAAAPLLDTAGVEPSNRSSSKLFGACAHSDTGAAGAMSAGGVEPSRGSFSKLLGPCAGALHAGSHAAGGVEHSRGSFSKLFGACAGGEQSSGAAAAAAHTGASVEHSRGSFSRLFGPCAGSDPAHAAAGLYGVDYSRGSFSRLNRGSSSTENGSGSGHDAERSRNSFSRLLGMYAGSDAAAAGADGGAAAELGKPSCGKPATDKSAGSFTKLGVEKSGSSFSKLFGACAGCDPGGGGSTAAAAAGPHGLGAEGSFQSFLGVEKSSNSLSKLFGSCAGCDPAAAAAAADVSHGMQVERSNSSLSKLFGPCAWVDLSAAALVEGSSRSFSRMFSSCGNCAGNADMSQHAAAEGASIAPDATTDGTLPSPPASIAGSDAAAAAVAAAAVAAPAMATGTAVPPQPQLESMQPPTADMAGLDLQLHQQQYLAQQQRLQLQQQQQQQHELQQQHFFLRQLQQQVYLQQQQQMHQQPALPVVPETAVISSGQEGGVPCDTAGMQYSSTPAAAAGTGAAAGAGAVERTHASSAYAGMDI